MTPLSSELIHAGPSCEWCGDIHTRCDACGCVTLRTRCPDCGEYTCEVQASQTPAHKPRRDDDVAAWLLRMRDQFTPYGDHWGSLNDALDRYRECADCGLTLRPEDDERGMP